MELGPTLFVLASISKSTAYSTHQRLACMALISCPPGLAFSFQHAHHVRCRKGLVWLREQWVVKRDYMRRG